MKTLQHANFLLAYLFRSHLFTSLHYNQPDRPTGVISYDMRYGLHLLFKPNEDILFIELFDSVMSRWEINEH